MQQAQTDCALPNFWTLVVFARLLDIFQIVG
jgi:hypothetical protein